jgi:hypothetical protein
MDFHVFIRTILASQQQDWSHVDAPTFLQSMGEVQSMVKECKAQNRWIEVQEHYALMTYKPNMSIAMAKGLPFRDTFVEPWTECFSNKRAWSLYVDLLWNGMPVHREIGVVVDGGLCTLPLPLPGTTDVPQGRFDLFVLIHELIGGGSNYHDYCRRAGLKPVAHDWPK